MATRIAILAVAASGALTIAQAQTPPADNTSPSTSSPPPVKEAPATESNASRPSSASSPHQRQATGKEPHAQMMKDCIARERAANSSVSESAAKKTCKEQLKSESSNR